MRSPIVAALILTLAGSAGAAEPICPGGSSPDPGVLFCEDYEAPNVGSRFDEHNTQGGSFVRVAGQGVGGSHAMRATFTTGQVGAGWLVRSFGRTPPGFYSARSHGNRDFREIYWREYVRTDPGWSGAPHKLSRVYSIATGNWAQAMIAHLWPGYETYLVADPASGIDTNGNLITTSYNDFAHLRWLGGSNPMDAGWSGNNRGTTRIFDAANADRWFCVEAHVKLNTPGQQDGVFEFWVDGNPEGRLEGLNWVGTWQEYGINAVSLENYWNGGSPQRNVRYRDNLVVSESRIGCLQQGPTDRPARPILIQR